MSVTMKAVNQWKPENKNGKRSKLTIPAGNTGVPANPVGNRTAVLTTYWRTTTSGLRLSVRSVQFAVGPVTPALLCRTLDGVLEKAAVVSSSERVIAEYVTDMRN